MNARVRLALVSALIVIGVLVLVGATYQGVATALERRRYPHPGQLLDVGGHQLHIHCVGEGMPTVVLEAPAGSMSGVWGWVQPEVAKFTRVCSYDRAGLGWSEAGDRPYDPGRVPEELHTLLMAAKQPPPWILAGHSLGAWFVQRFAKLYPAETAAVIVIDGPNESERSARFMKASPWLARAGVLRATGLLSDGWNGLPPASVGGVRAFLHRPDHLTRAAKEIGHPDSVIPGSDHAALRGKVPVRQLSADLNDENDARRVTIAIVGMVQAARRAAR